MSEENGAPAEVSEDVSAQAAQLAEKMFREKLAEETSGLKRKNSQLLGEVKALKQRQAELPEDFDPEQWNELKTEHEKRAEERKKAEGRWSEIKDELVSKHTKALQEREEKITSIAKQLENVLVTGQAASAVAKHKGNWDILAPHVRANVKMVEENGEFHARVIGKNGNPRMAENGDFLTVEQLVEEMKHSDTFAPLFEGTKARGSGAAGGNGAGGASGNNPWSAKSLNRTEQARILRENPQLAARLREEAEAG